MIAAADENRDELQDIWAALLAAAADRTRNKSFRLKFIQIARLLDPVDAELMRQLDFRGGRLTGEGRNELAELLKRNRDEIDVSIRNVRDLGLADESSNGVVTLSALGREFLRAIS